MRVTSPESLCPCFIPAHLKLSVPSCAECPLTKSTRVSGAGLADFQSPGDKSAPFQPTAPGWHPAHREIPIDKDTFGRADCVSGLRWCSGTVTRANFKGFWLTSVPEQDTALAGARSLIRGGIGLGAKRRTEPVGLFNQARMAHGSEVKPHDHAVQRPDSVSRSQSSS